MKTHPWQKIDVAQLMAQSRASEILMQGVRKKLLAEGYEEVLPGEFVLYLPAKKKESQMTKEQRDNVRAQLRQPFAAHETWWHAIAEQLLHDTEAAWDDGAAEVSYDYGSQNSRKIERQEWERNAR